MYRVLSFILLLALAANHAVIAQKAPSWVKKSVKSVCSIITYDASGAESGRAAGIFVSEDGQCVTDYKLLVGVDSVIVITHDGKQYPVCYVEGCDDIYDLARMKVDVKSVSPIPFAEVPAKAGDKVYVIQYSRGKDYKYKSATVTAVENARDGDHFYTLSVREKFDDVRSCPVVNADGELLGIYQYGAKDTTAYACGVRMAMGLSFDAFMFQDVRAAAVRLLKKLPDNANDAQVALVMGRPSMTDDRYLDYLNIYKEQFPDVPYAYEQLAYYYAGRDADQSVKCMEAAIERYANKDEACYAKAKFIEAASDSLGDRKGYSLGDAYDGIRQAVGIDPQPLYYQLKGRIEWEFGDYASAIQSYKAVLGSNLCSVQAINEYLTVNELNGMSADSMVILIDTLQHRYSTALGADSVELLYAKALYLNNAGDFAKSLQSLMAYSAAHDEQMTADFYYFREQIALKARRYQQAINDIGRALQLVPDDISYRLEYAGLCIIIDNLDEAISTLEQCRAMSPDNTDVNRLLGLALIQAGRKDEGRAYLIEARENGDIAAGRLLEQYAE